MLDNILSPDEAVDPPKDLREDVRALESLDANEVEEAAKVFRQLAVKTAEEEQKEALKLLSSLVSAPERHDKLLRALRVSVFVARRWGRRRLTRKAVEDDLKAAGVPIERLKPLLDTIEAATPDVDRRQRSRSVVRTGPARIESAVCVVEARAIFERGGSEDDEKDGALDGLVPVATLEIVSELNDEKENHCFLLTPKDLGELCRILKKAETRMHRLEEALPKNLVIRDY